MSLVCDFSFFMLKAMSTYLVNTDAFRRFFAEKLKCFSDISAKKIATMLFDEEFLETRTARARIEWTQDSHFSCTGAYLLLCTGSWAQRRCRGSGQRCRRAAAPWPALDYEGLPPGGHMAGFMRPRLKQSHFHHSV